MDLKSNKIKKVLLCPRLDERSSLVQNSTLNEALEENSTLNGALIEISTSNEKNNKSNNNFRDSSYDERHVSPANVHEPPNPQCSSWGKERDCDLLTDPFKQLESSSSEPEDSHQPEDFEFSPKITGRNFSTKHSKDNSILNKDNARQVPFKPRSSNSAGYFKTSSDNGRNHKETSIKTKEMEKRNIQPFSPSKVRKSKSQKDFSLTKDNRFKVISPSKNRRERKSLKTFSPLRHSKMDGRLNFLGCNETSHIVDQTGNFYSHFFVVILIKLYRRNVKKKCFKIFQYLFLELRSSGQSRRPFANEKGLSQGNKIPIY